MKKYAKFILIITLVSIYLATGWIFGLLLLGALLLLLVRDLLRARRALAPTTTCPWCQATVEQYGAFSCASCRSRTLGWAWRCGACAAEHGHIECANCGLSVPNPLLPRP